MAFGHASVWDAANSGNISAKVQGGRLRVLGSCQCNGSNYDSWMPFKPVLQGLVQFQNITAFEHRNFLSAGVLEVFRPSTRPRAKPFAFWRRSQRRASERLPFKCSYSRQPKLPFPPPFYGRECECECVPALLPTFYSLRTPQFLCCQRGLRISILVFYYILIITTLTEHNSRNNSFLAINFSWWPQGVGSRK